MLEQLRFINHVNEELIFGKGGVFVNYSDLHDYRWQYTADGDKISVFKRGIVTKNSNDMVDANGNPLEYYAINRHAANRDMIGIIIEHCFMDNEEDKQFIADDEALKRLGEADARGIAAYFGY